MIVGIRLHDLKVGTITEVKDAILKQGFDTIQLVFKKALRDEENKPLLFNYENALKVSEGLQGTNIKIAMLGAYFNPVHSNKELVRNNIEYFKEHLRYAHLLNTKYVGTETGSYNDDKWTYNPKNQTEEGYQETMQVFKELARCANEHKTTLLMEPAYGHVIYCVDLLKRAIDELNCPYVKVTIDLFNLLYLGNYSEYKDIFHKAMITFGDDIKIIHLKDFYVEGEKLVQCGLGKGIIDFKYIIKEIKENCPNATLIFEGVTGEDIISSQLLINSLNN
ncbi:MAG: sugar phosphate isomerase/epimerase family protein [Bacilli bacterium]